MRARPDRFRGSCISSVTISARVCARTPFALSPGSVRVRKLQNSRRLSKKNLALRGVHIAFLDTCRTCKNSPRGAERLRDVDHLNVQVLYDTAE